MIALAHEPTGLTSIADEAKSRLAAKIRRMETDMTYLWPRVGLVEARIFGAGKFTKSGVFDNPLSFAAQVAPLDGMASSIYCTVNPVSPDTPTRKGYGLNHIRDYVPKGSAISDEDILCRTQFFIDIDPVYVADNAPSTQAEHCEALALQGRIVQSDFMAGLGFREHIELDSGNGAYLLYAVDLPNTDESRHLIKGCLQALANRFDCAGAKVDTSTHNAARLMRVPGTLNRKWPATPERPNRRTYLIIPEVAA